MYKNKSIAIAIVDTMQHTLAANALYNSLSGFQFDQVLIYSNIQSHWGHHQINLIEPIHNINEYNEIIIQQLPRDLLCDFVLIIQYDGFIINPHLFDPIFLNFDYIGAPWFHLDQYNVGNGGFSLRSKKLINFVSQLSALDYNVPEDMLICQNLRSAGILNKFSFAPQDLANIFSYEHPKPSHDTFGFHGLFNLPYVYENNLDFLMDHICPSTVFNKFNFLHNALSSLSLSHANRLKSIYDNYLSNHFH